MEPERQDFLAAVRRAREYDDDYMMGGYYRDGQWSGVDLAGLELKTVTGQMLTVKDIADKNTFEQPDVVKPVAFKGAKLSKGKLVVKMPPMSIVALELK